MEEMVSSGLAEMDIFGGESEGAPAKKRGEKMKGARREKLSRGPPPSPSGEGLEEEPPDTEVYREEDEIDNFRVLWDSRFDGEFGSFDDQTSLGPMRYTSGPTPQHARPDCTMNIYDIRVVDLEDGLQWPLHVHGLVAARDSADHNRNFLFNRTRDNCQILTQEDPHLPLTGPSRFIRPRRTSDGDITAEVLGDEAGADIDDARARQAVDPEGAGAEEEVLAADADVADVAKLEEAATEAARRARQHRQSIIEDIPRFCIELGVTDASFHRMMMKRHRRILDICSMKLWGHPVTPPLVDDGDTFHIVELLSGKDSVEILFRESDLYFVGFRPRPADHNDDPKFYLFNDVVNPKWPEWLPYRTLSYDSGYGSIVAGITVGRHCFPSIFTKLLDFKPENYKTKSIERGKAFHWTMIMLSEALRIRPVQQMVERTLDTGTVEQIGKSLDNKIHNWARKSRDVFADVSSNDINWELIGCDGDLLTLKFSEEEALPVIIAQQNKVAAAVMLTEINSLIGIHFSANWQQLPNFHNCLILLLASEKGISVEVRQVVGLMLKNNLRLAFSSMPPSSQKYIKSEVSTCIGSPNKEIRSIACTVVSVLLQIVGFAGWIELFDTLGQCLDNHDLNQKEGAAEAICKICKDFPEDFRVDADLSELPIHDIMQRLMQLFKYPYAILRKLAVVKNPALLSHVCMDFASLKGIQSEGLPSKVCHVLNDLKQLGVMIAGADACPP